MAKYDTDSWYDYDTEQYEPSYYSWYDTEQQYPLVESASAGKTSNINDSGWYDYDYTGLYSGNDYIPLQKEVKAPTTVRSSSGNALSKPASGLSTPAMTSQPIITQGERVVQQPTTVRSAAQSKRSRPTYPVIATSGSAAKDTTGTATSTSGTASTSSGMSADDTALIKSLTQQFAAPGVRRLRQALQTATGGYYENPNVKAMTLRQALEGYGSGLESVMAGAGQTALGTWGTLNQNTQNQLNRELQQTMQSNQIAATSANTNAQIAANAASQQYQMLWQEYLAGL